MGALDPSTWGGTSTSVKDGGVAGGGVFCVSSAASGGSASGAFAAAGTALVGSALRWRLGFAEDRDDVPIAERFRRACEEVEQERSVKREKNHRKNKNRRMRALGSAERHIYQSLDDVSLVDRSY